MSPHFTNRDRLRRKLRDYPPAIVAQIRPAMESSADQIVAMQRALAPVEHGARPRRTPGTLRDSIGWTWGDVARGVMSAVSSAASSGRLKLTIYAGSAAAFYARFVEFGTHGGSKGGYTTRLAGNRLLKRKQYRNHPGSKAEPYFYPAFRANLPKAKAAIKAAVRAATKLIANS